MSSGWSKHEQYRRHWCSPWKIKMSCLWKFLLQSNIQKVVLYNFVHVVNTLSITLAYTWTGRKNSETFSTYIHRVWFHHVTTWSNKRNFQLLIHKSSGFSLICIFQWRNNFHCILLFIVTNLILHHFNEYVYFTLLNVQWKISNTNDSKFETR